MGLIDSSDKQHQAALVERERTGHFDGELHFRRKDGTKFLAEISSTLFIDQRGNKRAGLFIRDVSERKRLENELFESEERNRLFFENSHAGILFGSIDGSYQVVNPVATRIFGWSEEEFKTLQREDLFDPDDDNILNALEERLRTGHYSGVLSHIRKDGSKFPAQVTSNLYVDRSGQIRSFTFIIDLSDLMKDGSFLSLGHTQAKYTPQIASSWSGRKKIGSRDGKKPVRI